jgi:hypothetical protein
LDSLQKKDYLGRQILDEIKALYPQIVNCSYGESFVFKDGGQNPEKLVIIVFKISGKYFRNSDKKKIEDWLTKKLGTNRVKVYYEY